MLLFSSFNTGANFDCSLEVVTLPVVVIARIADAWFRWFRALVSIHSGVHVARSVGGWVFVLHVPLICL